MEKQTNYRSIGVAERHDGMLQAAQADDLSRSPNDLCRGFWRQHPSKAIGSTVQRKNSSILIFAVTSTRHAVTGSRDPLPSIAHRVSR